jgi:hypothetical protein
MGCDIHAFVDYDQTHQDGVSTFHWGSIKLERNYWLFSLLAGVRGQREQSLQPKGLPKNMSWQVRREVYLELINDADVNDYTREGYVGREHAKKHNWTIIDEYHCEHPDWHSHSYLNLEELDGVIKNYMELSETLPVLIEVGEQALAGDVHVRTFLPTGTKLVKRTRKVTMPADLAALRAAMAALKDGGFEPRFIFFFDN